MGKLWCRHLPLVRVTQRDVAKPVTVIYPYYCQPEFLKVQISGWHKYAADLLRHLTIILVDDGSPEHDLDSATRGEAIPCAARLFRIEKDIRWNWLAARNLGAFHAKPGHIILTDLDHVIPETTLRSVMYGAHDPAVVYAFSRREHNGKPIQPHCNSWLMTRSVFWDKIRGYDESLSGYYGTDGEFRRRMAKVAPIHVLIDEFIRHEYVKDSSTTRYERKQAVDAAVGKIVASRPPGWKPKVLQQTWHEIRL